MKSPAPRFLQIAALAWLAFPAIAAAQFKSGPILFHNQSDKAIRVHCVLFVDGGGSLHRPVGHWDYAPGERSYLALGNTPVRAMFFAYRIQNHEGTTEWHSENSDFAANGDLALNFGRREIAMHRQTLAANRSANRAAPASTPGPSPPQRQATGRPRVCPICRGSGEKNWCSMCAGDGWYSNFNDLAFPGANGRSRCWKCGGDGREFCNHCSGTGVLR